jgi:hypothetical protein
LTSVRKRKVVAANMEESINLTPGSPPPEAQAPATINPKTGGDENDQSSS